jgi:prepilin-type N-terminal cleavage/methylation domain-containing protein
MPKNCYTNSVHWEEYPVQKKSRKRSQNRGFTATELLVAVAVAGLLVITGITFFGRKVVDDSDAIKAAGANGVVEGKVAERHNWLAWRHGCTFADADSFVVKGKTADGKEENTTVCCASWFRGCRAAKK